jgi:hypothetical protein
VNSIEEVKAECAKADMAGKRTVSIRICIGERFSHYLPYLFKRDPMIYFVGAVHNHLTRDAWNLSTLTYSCWFSPSHGKDPGRSLRILKRVNVEDSSLVREKYYLAREFFYHAQHTEAIEWFEKYLAMKPTHAAELADAYLFMSKCYWKLQQGDLAREAAAKAVNVNTNFREAILWLAEISGPVNRERWLEFAEGADNSNVLFRREKSEWKPEQYDAQFKADSDMSRYEEIHREIGRIVSQESVLDIGCGVAALAKHVPNYVGFDFSPEAVKIANHPGVRVGDAYDKANYNGVDWYVATEILEHLDDLRMVKNFPAGQKILFSVPSFADKSHLRVYNEAVVRRRFGEMLNVHWVKRFNWRDRRWQPGGLPTRDYILLVEATKL